MEVVRLVEDAIYEFEKGQTPEERHSPTPRPHFYSLQFDMRTLTPEIFAARGLVALKPPLATGKRALDRASGLATALVELLEAAEGSHHEALSLDDDLNDACRKLSQDLNEGLSRMEAHKEDALALLRDPSLPKEWLGDLRFSMGSRAGQGIYLLNADGDIVEAAVGPGQDGKERMKRRSFRDRSYFREAKTFRRPFVSDSDRSVFNRNSTVFLCVPLVRDDIFRGLLFSATQPGQWLAPLAAARPVWDKRLSFLLVDGNGVALVPPHNEFHPEPSSFRPPGESADANVGISFDRLLSVSRRDSLVTRVARNIVPLTQDDDIFEASADATFYTVVTEVEKTRWKLGISRMIRLEH